MIRSRFSASLGRVLETARSRFDFSCIYIFFCDLDFIFENIFECMDFSVELNLSGAVDAGGPSPVKNNLSKIHEDVLEYFSGGEVAVDEDIIAFSHWMQENDEGSENIFIN